MSEREYVETIKVAAKRYIEAVQDLTLPDAPERITRWEDLRDGLSAHTTIRMCEAWLQGDVVSDASRPSEYRLSV